MYEGHVKLFRKLIKSAFYQDSQYVHLWVHLLLSVNWSEKRLKINGSDKFIDLQPGQVLTSRDSLVNATGINRSKVERILKSFESEQQIEQQTFSKYRVISILNWSDYQSSEHQNEQQMSSKRAASEHKQEGKERKEKNPSPRKPRGYNSDHKIFIDWWMYAYKKIIGSKYFFHGVVDGAMVSTCLKQLTLEELIAVSAHYIYDEPDNRFPKGLPAIKHLTTAVTKYPPIVKGRLKEYIEDGIFPADGDFRAWHSTREGSQ